MRLRAGDTALQAFGHLAMHEGERRTLTQIATAIGRSERMTWSALNGLAEDDLVIVHQKPKGSGWGRLYEANLDHPLFPDLRSIIVKMLGGSEMIRELIANNHAVEAAAIFGSVAAGTDRRTGRLSDIDLLVIFGDSSSREDRMLLRAAIDDVSARLNREINVEGMLRSEWERDRDTNRALRRIAAGDLIALKGDVHAKAEQR